MGLHGDGLALCYTLRKATLEDQATLKELIARSIRHLGASDYSPEQIDAALRGAFGVDTALIRDGTYFVAVSAGFFSFELLATLPGVRLYEKCGYLAGEAVSYPLPDGLSIGFVPMSKRVGG